MGVNNGILNNLEFVFNNTSAGSMMVSDGTSSFVKFRDPSAWYHIVVAIDSTQGTASNRVKVYVNGTQRDVELRIDGGSQTTDVPLTQNYDLGFLTASKHQIGMNVESSNSEPYDGYLSEFYFVDGQQYAPTVFAETDDIDLNVDKDEIEDANWFDISQLKDLTHPDIKYGFKLPRFDSIARRLVNDWIRRHE